MSEPLVVSIPHRLGKDEALRRLKTGLAEVGTRFGHVLSVREQTWTGDHLHFQVAALGQSASGSIDVAEDYVRLECSYLGFWRSSRRRFSRRFERKGRCSLRRSDELRCKLLASVALMNDRGTS